MENIKKYSRILKLLFGGLALLYPVISACYWGFAPALPDQAYASLPVALAKIQWNHWTKMIGFAVTLPSTLILSRVFFILKKIFESYQQGSVFSLNNSENLHRIGKLMIYYVIINVMQVPALSFGLTFQNPPGQRVISASLSSNDFSLIVIVLIAFILGWIHKEAFRINEESKLTI